MDTGKIILLILVSTLWAFTLSCLVYALSRRRLLSNWRGHPDFKDIKLYANDQILFEVLRLTKHSLIVWLIAVTPEHPPPIMEARNVVIALVGVLIGVTSAWTLFRKHRRFRHFMERAAK